MGCAALLKLSLIDFPGHVAAVVFIRGCPFRCFYCHNPELVVPERYGELLDRGEILAFLKKRVGLLDGVCITGGEPTSWSGLSSFITDIAQLGFAVKLDSNGFYPDRLWSILQSRMVSYVAMDIKAPLARYQDVVGVQCDPERIQASIDCITDAYRRGFIADYEFRTTLVKPTLTSQDAHGIGTAIKGARRYCVQNFTQSKHVGDVDMAEPFSTSERDEFVMCMGSYVQEIVVRS